MKLGANGLDELSLIYLLREVQLKWTEKFSNCLIEQFGTHGTITSRVRGSLNVGL